MQCLAMLIKKIPLPENSLFKKLPVKYNYSDSYSALQPIKDLNPEVFATNFLSGFPSWVHALLELRHFLVKRLKIAYGNEAINSSFQPLQKGNKFSFCEIIDFNNEELLLYAPDKHLDIWISFMVISTELKQELIITTIVKFNNLAGRLYFVIIKPFHKLIIKSKMRKTFIQTHTGL